jgi:CheY-like chemotaxis protein
VEILHAMQAGKNFHSILMLEHDDDDRFITTTIFNELNLDVDIRFVHNSDELFNYLNTSKENLNLPGILLINLNARPLNGVEILKRLKSNFDFQHIPIVILSGSTDKNVVKECYGAGASSFIQKPSLNSDNHEKIISFFRYWFQTVELAV